MPYIIVLKKARFFWLICGHASVTALACLSAIYRPKHSDFCLLLFKHFKISDFLVGFVCS